MNKAFLILLLVLIQNIHSQRYTVLDSIKKSPVSYATISFGNGNGLFADADGVFEFSEKRYADIDSLFISALGYKEFAIDTKKLSKKILLTREIAELQEVIVTAENLGKYKTKKKNAKIHNDYFKCWLPTVESEIAVFFPRDPLKSTKIASVFLPVKMESSRGSSGKKQAFSTLFKMQFYRNYKGTPGKRLPSEDIIFNITNKDKSNFELDISEYKVFIPKEGLFVSLQVLGYADKEGKLQHTKKYHEVETNKGIIKISTTFRPLLPFTDKIADNITFTRRVFFKNRTWQRFDKKYSDTNNLIKTNHMNYGIGLKTHVYEK
ncbi:carboxypeptidase-like regulatory domain-containing protein [Aquimarina sp. RZ0]|uniref:carboxypeptidase-like regulatory domain-containing protein n=1 Tax=Aquimarina sp. RZ0 TaxID=2607730 RepID=UPI0011F367FF|nr:carboxypeptidase-like regulatory domain-containing protein [Aquimarina sp. RZ0]KAA1246965.1 carboxypeptidase-like regulatory domain-containing protein [Aquimarina sp. RZ0]